MRQGKIACCFEDLTTDTTRNRLVRAALDSLASRVSDPALAQLPIARRLKTRRDPGYESRGIWFQSGLIVNNPSSMKVFLVSEGDIGITYLRNSTESRDAQALSMVAGGDIELMGPSTGYTFKLYHDSNMDALADDLVARGALPPTTGGSGTAFAYVGSSWKELRLP